MTEETTNDDLVHEFNQATSANPQDRGYIPDQIDGAAQADGIPPLGKPGTVTQSPYDEHGALANAGIPPAGTPPSVPPPTQQDRPATDPARDDAGETQP